MKKTVKINDYLENFNGHLVEIKLIPTLEIYLVFKIEWGFEEFLNKQSEIITLNHWLSCEIINQTETLKFYKLSLTKTATDRNIDDILSLIIEYLKPINEQLKKEIALEKIIQKEKEKTEQKIAKIKEKYLKKNNSN